MIRDQGVAARYAQALFGAAAKADLLEPVLVDLHSLEQLYEQDKSLQNFLEAPDVLTEHKLTLVADVLRGRVSELVIRFLVLMLEKKRVQHLPLAFEHYRDLVEKHLGVQRARVVTAVPLAGDLAQALQVKLEKLTGKKINLVPLCDPDIVGGIIVTLGEKTIDASIRYRLGELREQLLAARVH